MLEENKTTKQTEISAFASLASELNSLKFDLSSLGILISMFQVVGIQI